MKYAVLGLLFRSDTNCRGKQIVRKKYYFTIFVYCEVFFFFIVKTLRVYKFFVTKAKLQYRNDNKTAHPTYYLHIYFVVFSVFFCNHFVNNNWPIVFATLGTHIAHRQKFQRHFNNNIGCNIAK